MWWHYLLVLLGAFLVDVSAFPLPPAFTIMVFLQITFQLEMWLVVVLGVIGSIAGRYVLTQYVQAVSARVFNKQKKEEVEFLGNKLKEQGWKSQVFILTYSLLPLPTTPLFVAAGMTKLQPFYIIPAFFVGKTISDTAAVLMGKYAAENSAVLIQGILTWKSMTGLTAALLLIFVVIFIDWITLIREKKFRLKFQIWK